MGDSQCLGDTEAQESASDSGLKEQEGELGAHKLDPTALSCLLLQKQAIVIFNSQKRQHRHGLWIHFYRG